MRIPRLALILVLAGAWSPGLPAPASAAFSVQAGIGFVAVQDAGVGSELVLEDRAGQEVARGNADEFGSLIFRDLAEGARFTVRESAPGGQVSEVRTLRFSRHPKRRFYRAQTLVDGFQYIEARDGTLLAAMVRPPFGKSLEDGPFPTVVEYSGYPAADPDNPQPSTLLASFLGFATVGVNMRGSGCSGGTLGLFDLPTTADGFDVVETVAAQPWVLHHKVGMVGISFPGISQVFVGGARPPHLAAIAPLSVIEDIYRAPGFPGGIFNDGFAKSWLEDRQADSEPAPDGGQAYAQARIEGGDDVCLANQKLRRQTLDPFAITTANPFYQPEIMDVRSPRVWISKIKVPTFLAQAWQDEQTSDDAAWMFSLAPKRKNVKITLVNGVHPTPIEPEILWRWLEFLQIYVAREVPDTSALPAIAPLLYPEILGAGAPTPPLPAARFTDLTSLGKARKRFEADPRVRVLFENGAGSEEPGLPAPTFELGFDAWPPAEAQPTTFYFGVGGVLLSAPPSGPDEGIDAYAPDPEARPMKTLLPGGNSWDLLPEVDWQPLAGGTAAAWATPPLETDVTIVGPGSVDLWLRSSAADTDLQVTLSEIRPDDLETYVQSGWLRASHRKLDEETSTELDPRPTHLEADAAPLPAGEFTLVRVGLFPAGHVFRAGSRIRISVEAPGGDRTEWSFDTPPTGGSVTNEIAHTAAMPSALVLPVVPGVDPPDALPPCPGLRGQPCRAYVAAGNGG